MNTNAFHRLEILIADDVLRDIEEIKSHLLPQAAQAPLQRHERVAMVDSLLLIRPIHTVPDTLEHIRKHGVPDIAVIDLNFKYAARHAVVENGMDEGMILIDELSKYGGLHLFCLTTYVDSDIAKLEALGIGERAIQKNQMDVMTRKMGEVLRSIAAQELAGMHPDEEAALLKQLDTTPDWRYLVAKVAKKRYALRNLMAGWCVLSYDEVSDGASETYPQNMPDIIKALLPYANTKKN